MAHPEFPHTGGEIIHIYYDLNTLLLCLLFGNLFTVLLIWAYRSRSPKDLTSSIFVIGKCLQLALIVMLMLGNFISPRLHLPVGAMLGLGSGMVEAMALLLLLDISNTRVRFTRYYVVAGAVAAVLLFTNIAFGEVRLLMAGPLLISALFLIYPAYRLVVRSTHSPLQKMIGLLYGVAVVSLICGALTMLFPGDLWGISTSQGLRVFFYTGLYLLMFLGTAGFMLLSREQSYAELERVATYDELTGILNRRSFVLRARPLIAAAVKEITPFSFLLLDVDHFKSVNDTYGHDTGDKVLRDFASKIEQQLRGGDLFGRFGGEEFAVLLHRADEKTSDEIAERLRTAVLGATVNGAPLDYSVSIGIITVQSSERISLNALYKLSDMALYQAKEKGRNCVVRSYG